MRGELKIGDHVSWNSEAGRVTGIIRKKISAPIEFKGYTVRASREEPQYLIESDKTDHVAVHKRQPAGHRGGQGRMARALRAALPFEVSPMCMETMTAAIDALVRRGFTENLSVVGNRLRVAGTRASFKPTDLVIVEHRRFEGVSDPDDMAILYAIEAKGGIRGTLVDAYGVYSDPLISAFMRAVPITERHR